MDRRLALTAVLGLALLWLAAPAGAAAADFPSKDSGYHNYAEMVAEIQEAEADHPAIVDVFSIGKSYKGRTIWAAKVSDNVATDENEPEVLFDGLHHAREHLTVEQTLAIYTDQLLNADNWSWATVDMANATPVHSGTRSIKVTAGAYEAVRVHFSTPISPAPYTALSFWLHGGATGGQPLLLQATVNDQALALVTKLGVSPEDNPTSQTLSQQAAEKLAELDKLDAAAFDKAYLDNEIAYHVAVNSALSSLLIPSAQNAELKALLETGLQLFTEHQHHAEMVAAELK